MTGLPAGNAQTGYLGCAADYTEHVMNELGWMRIIPPGDGEIPADGAVMVMDRGAKGADANCGNMAVVRGNPTYDYSTQKWTITVDEVDWFGNCNVSRDTTPLPGTEKTATWGDLYGINFYTPAIARVSSSNQ